MDGAAVHCVSSRAMGANSPFVPIARISLLGAQTGGLHNQAGKLLCVGVTRQTVRYSLCLSDDIIQRIVSFKVTKRIVALRCYVRAYGRIPILSNSPFTAKSSVYTGLPHPTASRATAAVLLPG